MFPAESVFHGGDIYRSFELDSNGEGVAVKDRRVNDLESQGWPAAGRQCIVMAANACLRRAEVYRGVLTQAAACAS